MTTPFLLCPPPLSFRSKRPRGGRGKTLGCFESLFSWGLIFLSVSATTLSNCLRDPCSCGRLFKPLMHGIVLVAADEEMDAMLKKSSFWSGEDGSGALGTLNFRNLAMDSSWAQRPQQRVEPGTSTQQNVYYRALAAAALQEFRVPDAGKPLANSSLSSSQMQFRSQTPQLLHQQSTHHLSEASAPLLQLLSSRSESPLEVGVNMPQCSGYSEGDIHMVSSSPSASGSFPLHSMLGRTHLDSNLLMRPAQSGQHSQSGPVLNGGSAAGREPQVINCNLAMFALKWFALRLDHFKTISQGD